MRKPHRNTRFIIIRLCHVLGLSGWLGYGSAAVWAASENELRPSGASLTTMPPGASANDCINDDRILKSITEELAKRLDAGQAVPMKTLQLQLERNQCVLNLPSTSGKRLSPVNIYAKCKESVLVAGTLYKCPKCHQWHVNSATGFLLTTSGVFATTYHVVNGPDLATMGAMTADGKTYLVKEVLAASKEDDVAILQLAGVGFSPIGLSTSEPVGTPVVVISHPDNGFYTMTQGIVSRYFTQKKPGAPVRRLAITADFAKGSSGAPVLNELGRAVGMVASTHSVYYNTEGGQEKNLQMVVKTCVPSEAILKLVNKASKH